MVCKILHLAVYPVEKEGGMRRTVALSLQKGLSIHLFGQRWVSLVRIQYPSVCRNALMAQDAVHL